MQWLPHLVHCSCQYVCATLASCIKWARDRSQEGGMNVAQVDAGKSVEKVDRDWHRHAGESESHHKCYRDFPFLLPSSSFPATSAPIQCNDAIITSHQCWNRLLYDKFWLDRLKIPVLVDIVNGKLQQDWREPVQADVVEVAGGAIVSGGSASVVMTLSSNW